MKIYYNSKQICENNNKIRLRNDTNIKFKKMTLIELFNNTQYNIAIYNKHLYKLNTKNTDIIPSYMHWLRLNNTEISYLNNLLNLNNTPMYINYLINSVILYRKICYIKSPKHPQQLLERCIELYINYDKYTTECYVDKLLLDILVIINGYINYNDFNLEINKIKTPNEYCNIQSLYKYITHSPTSCYSISDILSGLSTSNMLMYTTIKDILN